ncbi:type VI secretion system baseplate subunit TssG [Vibrio viridaestus]|uniref:Type VI secretion system baseplate subunit TssG n=1 Tax=Vibrio viridaestus TaxID=2487322 RepID=A0A3N9TM44_9VIBR|nr:type VI secretion system baseplate subunit TssG [Vibrio viridaestus]RQW65074.1 type VI secretion system baseplate subunit TssG [Vibrio viridaestus]
MGNSDRYSATDIEKDVLGLDNPRSYNFFQLVETIHKFQDWDPESDDWEKFCKLVFSANPSLGFSTSDVTDVEMIDSDRVQVETSFFGLAGANSPLPGFIIEQLIDTENAGLKRPFLDFFNNRMITLIYRMWRKYRYHVRFKPGAEDPFSQQLFALIGLADPRLRSETKVNWAKMLAYSGMLAGRSRSPQVVAGIIGHCFDLDDVSIRQWEKRKINIDASQQFSLGGQNSELGVNTLTGSTAFDCNGKFSICIGGLSRQRFTDFLPTGKDFNALKDLVEFILREQLSYDLELSMNEKDIPDFKLDSSDSLALGWYTFLGKEKAKKNVQIQVRG